jgi:hypothetical protein
VTQITQKASPKPEGLFVFGVFAGYFIDTYPEYNYFVAYFIM